MGVVAEQQAPAEERRGRPAKDVGQWQLAGSESGQLIQTWLHRAARSPRTKQAYTHDVEMLRRFLHAASPEKAVAQLLRMKSASAYQLAEDYRGGMQAAGLSPATQSRRLASLVSLLRTANRLGLIDWTLQKITLPAVTGYRDTRGPGEDGVRKMMDAALGRRDAKGARDLAILHLLFDLALRTAEVLDLALEHLDLDGRRVFVLWKSRTQRQWMHLPVPTLDALVEWIVVYRGREAGPLWIRFGGSTKQRAGGLSSTGLRLLVNEYARLARIRRATPHGIRHAAITKAAQVDGRLLAVQQFARHKDLNTTRIYIDNVHNEANEMAEAVAERGHRDGR